LVEETEMYEVHGWFGLAESTEAADVGGLFAGVEDVRHMLEEHTWPTISAAVEVINGQPFLVLTGFANRRREEATFIDDVVEFVSDRLPGSWGLLYERDDEMPPPPGPNAFRVTALARGRLLKRLDPFLSPCIPTIED
jgi:hypothetical protein